ncbi:calcium-independent phospholipase A2-gamma-like [Cylas formicarius]|uniref:calcium-independent phospholipase A2-gamma-like n=1 Tax=Cylas formicarius TaxID=197179 RepID=UPI0029585C94|nr:calcium-independent phospholipase A2-gamma-like [Cylas formicarius]
MNNYRDVLFSVINAANTYKNKTIVMLVNKINGAYPISKSSGDFHRLANHLYQLLHSARHDDISDKSVKYLSSAAESKTSEPMAAPSKSEKSVITFPNVFTGTSKDVKVKTPKWKIGKPLTKDFMSTKVNNMLTSIVLAETETTKLAGLENLISYIKQHPDARHIAVKEGAISTLLSVRKRTKTHYIHCALKEALALLGHADPVRGKGIRILSIDGGGTRGILVIEMLRKLEELSGKPVYEMFDLICGVSTGAIIGTLMGLKQHTLDEVSEIYRRISSQVFTQSPLRGTSNLVWSHSYYDTDLWEKLLSEQWGNKTLIETARNLKCPKFCAVSAVVNHSRLVAYVFRNYSLPCKVQSQYMGDCVHAVWEAVRASAAAPTYFEEFKIGNMIHQDGGILVNNPTAVAIHEAKLLWPCTPIQCVVSFGTGRTSLNPIDFSEPAIANNTSWKNKFFAIIDSATDTEGIHIMLSDLLPADVYYRFNPYLTEMLEMTEINPQKLDQLEKDALMYLRRNEDKFQQVTRKLGESKGLWQRLMEWLALRRQLHNLKL